MEDFNKKLKDRWQHKRNKAFNWTSLIIKVLILVAILFAINRLSKSNNIEWSKTQSQQDTVQVAPDSIKG